MPTRTLLAALGDTRSASEVLLNRDEVWFDRRTAPTATPFGWSAISGLTVSGQVDTLTGSEAYGNLNSFVDGPPVLVAETVAVIASTQKLNLIIRVNTTVKLTFELDPTTNQVNVTGPDIATANLTPGNGLDLDGANGVRIALCIRPFARTAFLCLRYYNAAGADNPAKQVAWFSDDFAWSSGQATSLRFVSATGGTGTVTLTDTALFEPSMILTGDSIIAGSSGVGSSFSPYPGYAGVVRDMDIAYLLGRALGKRILNFGIASGGVSGVEGLNTNLLRFAPRMIVSNFGATNVLNVDGVDQDVLDALLTDVEALIDGWIAAGIMVGSIDCLPRNWSSDAGDAAVAALAVAYNAQQATWVATKGMAHAVMYDRFLGTGTNPSADLCPDETHPGTMGKRLFGGLTMEALGSARFAVRPA